MLTQLRTKQHVSLLMAFLLVTATILSGATAFAAGTVTVSLSSSSVGYSASNPVSAAGGPVTVSVTGTEFATSTSMTLSSVSNPTVTLNTAALSSDEDGVVTADITVTMPANTNTSARIISMVISLGGQNSNTITIYQAAAVVTTPTRPAITSGQALSQGDKLQLSSSYTLASADQFVVSKDASTFYTISTTGTVLSVTLPSTLPSGTYYLYVRNKTDTSVISARSSSSFLVSNEGPVVSSTTPANGSLTASVNTFSITFNKAMNTNVGTTIFLRSGSGTNPTITKTTWSNSNKTVTYTLSGVQTNATYTATIYNKASTGISAFADTAGNALQSETLITYTTGTASQYSNRQAVSHSYLSANISSSNHATAAADEDDVYDQLAQAISDEANGYTAVMALNITDLPTAAVSATVTISSSLLYDIAYKSNASLRINAGHLGVLTFDTAALSAIRGKGTGEIAISTEKLNNSNLTNSLYTLVGTDPAYKFLVKVGKNEVTNFGSGRAQVSIPYSVTSGYNKNQIVAYTVDNYVLEPVRGRYNATTAAMELDLPHFSTYVIKYRARTYSDVGATDWYKDAVDFAGARGLLDIFTTGTYLAPEQKITRAQFVVMLMDAYGIELDSAAGIQFSDVSSKASYAEYLRTAKGLGIIKGTNAAGTTFNPDGEVTREQFFTLTYNALTVLGELPNVETGKRLINFADANEFSTFSITATDTLVRTGVVAGSGGMLTPGTIFSRAELIQAVYNLIGY